MNATRKQARNIRALAVWGVLAALVWGGTGRAGVAELLPASTRQVLSVPDAARFRQAWDRTGYAKMFASEGLKELVEESSRAGVDGLGLGLKQAEVREAAGGEVAWAQVEIGPRHRARVFVVETAGKKADRLVEKITATLEKASYRIERGLVTTATGPGGAQRLFAVRGGALLCTDHAATLEAMLKPGAETLATKKAYQAARRDSGADEKDGPDVFLYLEPFALAQLNQREGKEGADALRTARDQGLEGVEAVGVNLRFGRGAADLTYRLAVYAPPPRKKALQLLQLQAGKEFEPPAWVPADAALAGVLYLDVDGAFRQMGPLFDAVYAPKDRGTFDEIIKRLRDDPNGPQVDIPRELVGRLGKRVVLVSRSPKAGGDEQTLLAFEAREVEQLERALGRLYENDEEAKRRQVRDYVVWVVQMRQSGRGGTKGKSRTVEVCLCAARGHLFVCTHLPLLEAALKASKSGLAGEADYQRVVGELNRAVPTGSALRWYARPDLDLRPAYEAFRQGEKAEGASVYATLLRPVFDNLNRATREKAPPFEKLRPYLGPAGMWGQTTPTGWVIQGFSLRRGG
ncbi:MAG: hypothetical protein U0840_03620 [Gemmataceae bacterium]